MGDEQKNPRKRFYKCTRCSGITCTVDMKYHKNYAKILCIRCSAKQKLPISEADKPVDAYRRWAAQ